MNKFTTFESRLVPLPVDNIDTDQIIPARFLKTISKDGLGDQLFNDWRYDAAGAPKPDFILNQPEAKGAQILLAGDNFGCGSSREHAPWALTAVRLPRRHQHLVRRHLPAELAQELAAARRGAARGPRRVIRHGGKQTPTRRCEWTWPRRS